MSVLRQFGLVALLVGTIFGQGWVGEGRVSVRDTSSSQPSIAMSSSGVPWVVWHGYYGGFSLMYSKWLGDRWDEERGVSPNAPGVVCRLRPSLGVGDNGILCLVWHNASSNNARDIGSCFWVDTCWSQETQVNLPDSIEDDDYAPKVACGGGQVWCVWYGGRQSLYSVFASRWNDDIGRWEPEMQVSPPDGRLHWWCDVGVDSLGTPHVVWCTHPLYTVFYSYYTGDSWTTPIPVNDTTKVTASPWADPHIVIDRTGMMHLSFTGAYRGASHRDIFYTRNDGSGWDTCQLVTRDAVYDEWYSDIAADRPDNVWVVWNRQNEGPDQFRVYASHYDGKEWSPEERLDTDSAYRDGGAVICLDNNGCPWVVWNATTYQSQDNDIYYNRYMSVGLEEYSGLGRNRKFIWTSVCAGSFKIVYELPTSSWTRLEVFDALGRSLVTIVDERKSAGRHETRWTGGVPGGVYFFLLTTPKFKQKCKTVCIK
ncbi:MAG: sialidase family protein [candidate division WOR-3 bacterium]